MSGLSALLKCPVGTKLEAVAVILSSATEDFPRTGETTHIGVLVGQILIELGFAGSEEFSQPRPE